MKLKTMLILRCLACALAALCLLLSGCSRTLHEAENHAPVQPSPSASSSNEPASQSAEAVGGTREQGDSSPEEFEGTREATDKTRGGMSPAVVRDVRTGNHSRFDRVVFEFAGAALPGYHIAYVNKPLSNCAGEDPVTLGGNAFLSITIMPAQAHTEEGVATIKELARKPNLTVLKELKSTCDFEADVTWILGLAARNRYRVLELTNPSRLVVDIKH